MSEPVGTQTETLLRRTRRVGGALVTIGVLVFPAWFLLLVLDSEPSLLIAIVLHLLFVIPGGILLRRGRPPADQAIARRRRLGELLVSAGVCAWIPYLVLSDAMGGDPPLAPFLALHLAGVVPGSLLRYTKLGLRR
jgi:hypothetical protein